MKVLLTPSSTLRVPSSMKGWLARSWGASVVVGVGSGTDSTVVVAVGVVVGPDVENSTQADNSISGSRAMDRSGLNTLSHLQFL
jgi:hypothetical protein